MLSVIYGLFCNLPITDEAAGSENEFDYIIGPEESRTAESYPEICDQVSTDTGEPSIAPKETIEPEHITNNTVVNATPTTEIPVVKDACCFRRTNYKAVTNNEVHKINHKLSTGIDNKVIKPDERPVTPALCKPSLRIDPKKLLAGSTMVCVNSAVNEQCKKSVEPNTYSALDASTFNTRSGPNYKRNGHKLPSLPALCDLAAIDFVDCGSSRVDCFGSHVQIPEEWGKRDTHHSNIPPLFIVNAQLPRDFSSSFFKTVNDGPGWSIVLYFRVSEATCDALADLNTAPAAVKLFAQYCMEAPESFTRCVNSKGAAPNIWAGRFKLILRCENIESYGLPSFITSYNSKPVLIRTTGSLVRSVTTDVLSNECNFLEMDINIHSFGSLPKKALEVMFTRFHQMQISMGFCIESRDEKEMPEVLFGCARLNMPTHSSAKSVPWVSR